jgi:hypothetical protein
MPCVGFKPTIPALERAKTVHALDHSATVTGRRIHTFSKADRNQTVEQIPHFYQTHSFIIIRGEFLILVTMKVTPPNV